MDSRKKNIATKKESSMEVMPVNRLAKVRTARIVVKEVGLPTINSSVPSRRSLLISKKEVNNRLLHMPIMPPPMITYPRSGTDLPAMRASRYPTALKTAGWKTSNPNEKTESARVWIWILICFPMKERGLYLRFFDDLDIHVLECGVADFDVGNHLAFQQQGESVQDPAGIAGVDRHRVTGIA